MILQKTAKAQAELQPGSRQLPQRARSVLLMAGGKSMEELHALLGSDHAALAQQLVEQGYLQLIAAQPTKPGKPQPPHMTGAAEILIAQPAAQLTPQASEAPAIHMAGTRMYLFDMCERLFANRHEALAQTLREQLRQARDLDSLRDAGLALLAAVEQHAGEERAQSLRERLAALLAHNEATEVAA